MQVSLDQRPGVADGALIEIWGRCLVAVLDAYMGDIMMVNLIKYPDLGHCRIIVLCSQLNTLVIHLYVWFRYT